MKIRMSVEQFVEEEYEGGVGYCTACGSQHEDYVDPDGREIHCTNCGMSTVYGLSELMMMGMIEFTGDDDE